MIEETAVVKSTEGDYATVETFRTTSCGSCDARTTCGTSALARVFGKRRSMIRVRNPIAARTGDRVVVGIREDALTFASFIFYILPLLALFAGALAGQALAVEINADSTEPLSVLGGLLGLMGGLGWLRHYSMRPDRSGKYQAVILRQAEGLAVRLVPGVDGEKEKDSV
jgi:sigma-E factor negative regulatory protein RseC